MAGAQYDIFDDTGGIHHGIETIHVYRDEGVGLQKPDEAAIFDALGSAGVGLVISESVPPERQYELLDGYKQNMNLAEELQKIADGANSRLAQSVSDFGETQIKGRGSMFKLGEAALGYVPILGTLLTAKTSYETGQDLHSADSKLSAADAAASTAAGVANIFAAMAKDEVGGFVTDTYAVARASFGVGWAVAELNAAHDLMGAVARHADHLNAVIGDQINALRSENTYILMELQYGKAGVPEEYRYRH